MTDHTLVHRALLYGKDEEFLGAAVPFLQEGLGTGDHILAVLPRNESDAVRDVMRGDAGHIHFYDAHEFYGHPVRTISAYNDVVRGVAPRRVRALASVDWTGRKGGIQLAEWARYESLVNVAFGSSGAQVICPYDRRVLPPPVIDEAMRTHPEMLSGGNYPTYNGNSYTDPLEFGARMNRRETLQAPPDGVDRIGIESLDLAPMRRFLKDKAAQLGLERTKLGGLVTAVNEIATNAVVHGTPPIELMVWKQDDELHCEVADIGLWHPDELAGFIPPADATAQGFGLWSARMLVDVIQIRAGYDGTRVRLRSAL
ncbi:sensor histidine kinase [Actinocorallia longicatena]|uniref:Anti-sigma factor RsbA family regulatory protein n=1 Tax=Actinocorallia longicatena TaxID=111803 RepID=A0ABP6QJK9_9ACTN